MDSQSECPVCEFEMIEGAMREALREREYYEDLKAEKHFTKSIRKSTRMRSAGEVIRKVLLGVESAESPIESSMVDILLEAGIMRFEQQWPFGPYRLDFAIPSLSLAIECDGKHHLEPGQMEHDAERDRYLSRLGWVTLRFTGREIYREPYRCLEKIKRTISILDPNYDGSLMNGVFVKSGPRTTPRKPRKNS